MNVHSRKVKQILLNETTGMVTIRFRASSLATEAKALEFKKNEHGDIVYLLLDRLIHQHHESDFDWPVNQDKTAVIQVSGCMVSALNIVYS